jgi:LysM repeat protein
MRKVALGAAVFVVAAIMVVGSKKASAQAPQNNTNQPQTVVVQPGDSLSKIGNNHNTTYQRLFYANTQIKDPDLIHPGDTLRVPRPDEQLAERPLPANAPAPAVQARQTTSRPVAQSAPAPTSTGGDVWDRLAQCESGGNWAINTGNGYYGGLQFSIRTWQAVGGVGYPHQASREEQITRGQILQARSGWGQWPACSTKLGLR